MTPPNKPKKPNLTEYRTIKSRPIHVVKDSADHHEDMFRLRLDLIAKRKTTVIWQDKEDACFSAIEHLAQIFALGQASPEVQQFIAPYLIEIVRAGKKKTAMEVLGLEKSGATNKDMNAAWAIEAYQRSKVDGAPCELRLKAAWEAYQDGNKDYETELNKKKVIGSDYSDSYIQSIETTIKPILRAAGVLDSKPRGGPKKLPKKT